MKRKRFKFRRFSISLAFGGQLWKAYFAYDSAKRHLCWHVGRERDKLVSSLFNMRVYQGAK